MDTKKPGETINVTFRLPAIASAVTGNTITASWRSGAADEAMTLALGAAHVDGTDLIVPVSGGVEGADYWLRAQIDTADGQHLIEDAVLSVRERA